MAYTDNNGVLQPDYTIFYKDYCAIETPLDVSIFGSVNIGGKLYDFQHMFEERNAFKEIGCETPELFKATANRRIKEVALVFNDKIEIWKNNLSAKLWNREVVSEETYTHNTYLNPTVAGSNVSEKPILQGTSTDVGPHHIITGNGVSNAEMMKEIMEVENIFYTALEALDNLFITLY